MQSLPPDRIALSLLLALIAGCVDAVGFAELGGHFASFMSGNTTRLGLHLVAREYDGMIFTAGLVALFVGGVAAGVLIVEKAGRAGAGAVLLAEAALLALAGWLLLGATPLRGAMLLPAAMGLANAFLIDERAGRFGLTYVTGTLVRIGTRLARLGEGGGGVALLLDLLLWAALLAGVTLGGIGRTLYGGEVLFAPAAALAILAIVELGLSRRAA